LMTVIYSLSISYIFLIKKRYKIQFQYFFSGKPEESSFVIILVNASVHGYPVLQIGVRISRRRQFPMLLQNSSDVVAVIFEPFGVKPTLYVGYAKADFTYLVFLVNQRQ